MRGEVEGVSSVSFSFSFFLFPFIFFLSLSFIIPIVISFVITSPVRLAVRGDEEATS